jgi:hypothetical protein
MFNIFKSKEDKLKLKIKQENLDLLDIDEVNDKYYLQKLLDWQEEYDYLDWIEFKDYCNSYDNNFCICYARN